MFCKCVLYIHVHKKDWKRKMFFNLNSFILHADVSVWFQYVLMQEYKHSYKVPSKLCDKQTFFFV